MRKNIKKVHNNYEDFLALGEYAFKYKLTERQKEEKILAMEKQTVFGAYNSDKLAAKLHIHPLEVFLGEEVFSMGGIAGVATWPESRRKGFIQDLMLESLEEMKQRGMSVSMLHPFSVGFYRKYGWELTNYIHKYNFSPLDIGTNLPKMKGKLKRGNFADYKDVLQAIYNKSAKQYSLMLKRENWWWEKRVLDEDDNIVIYYDNLDQAQGYLISNMNKENLKVEEFVFNNSEAFEGLTHWMKNHDSMTDQIELIVLPDNHAAFYFENPKITLNKIPYFMARIVDFEPFIKRYPFVQTSQRLKINLNIKDDYAVWNNGNWLLELGNNQVLNVVKNNTEKADIHIHTTIQTLSALLFGSESVDQLVNLNRIQLDGNKELIYSLFRPRSPAFLDFF